MSAVFDASVVVKWFVEDPLTDQASHARRTHGPAVAPSLMMVEVANVFRRYVIRRELELVAAQDNLSMIRRTVELSDHELLLDEAFALACRLNHSMTDCLYGVMARRRNLPLITADAKLARKLSGLDGMDVRLLDRREGEA